MSKKDEEVAIERAALASLQAVASDVSCSATSRVAAARAILDHLAGRGKQPAKKLVSPTKAPLTKTPAELRDELAELRRRRAIDALR